LEEKVLLIFLVKSKKCRRIVERNSMEKQMIIAMYEDNWQISKVKWVSHVIWGLRNGL
jgi:hypothetical protein